MKIDSLDFFARIAWRADRAASLDEIAAAPELRRYDGARVSTATARAVQGAGLFAKAWMIGGRQVYQLDHSIAALLSATRSEALEWDHLPHGCFLLDVPQEFCPAFADKPGGPPSRVLIAVGRIGTHRAFGVLSKDNMATFGIFPEDRSVDEELIAPRDIEAVHVSQAHAQHSTRIAIRLASNAIRFITQHRECVRRPVIRRSGDAGTVLSVRPPEGVSIDRAFRDLAAQLVSGTSLAGVKRALAHIVRGHWRNQAVGPGRSERRLTWVMPHKRGDESLGSVVSRIERIHASTARDGAASADRG